MTITIDTLRLLAKLAEEDEGPLRTVELPAHRAALAMALTPEAVLALTERVVRAEYVLAGTRDVLDVLERAVGLAKMGKCNVAAGVLRVQQTALEHLTAELPDGPLAQLQPG